MSRERVILPRKVREYLAEIGKRGGLASRRELTKEQARVMVEMREAKRATKKKGRPAPKLARKQQHILRTGEKFRFYTRCIVSHLRFTGLQAIPIWIRAAP